MNHHLSAPTMLFALLCLGALGALGCDKSSEGDGGKKQAVGDTATIKPAPGSPGGATPTEPPRPPGAPPVKAPGAPARSVSAEVNPLPGGPALQVRPTAGLDLASSARGVLSSGLKLEPGREPVDEAGADDSEKIAPKPPSTATVDDGLVPVKKPEERHALCQRLLDCTREAVKLAPDSVTSYNATRESVDSLDGAEAEAECRSDLSDLKDILRHLKKEIPSSCGQ